MTIWLTTLLVLAPAWQTDVKAEARVARAAGIEIPPLRGLDPAHYLARRRPGPEVGRELSRLRVPPAVLMAAYLDDTFAPSAPSRFPAHIRPAQIERWRAAERAAWREGILVTLARSDHPAVIPFLTHVARSTEPVVDALATTLLGRAGACDVLATLFNSRGASKVAVIRGAADCRNEVGLSILLAGLEDPAPEVRRAAVYAARRFASRWVREPIDRATRASLDDAMKDPAIEAILEPLGPASAH